MDIYNNSNNAPLKYMYTDLNENFTLKLYEYLLW